MTTSMLLRVLARRWYVLIVVFGLTALVFALLSRAGGAYETQSEVLLLGPGTDSVGKFDQRYGDTLVFFAAAIEREYHNGRPTDRLAERAPLFGAGVTRGTQVVLPNTGGQWEFSFARPAISVTVAGPTKAWVQTALERSLARIESIARDRQAQLGVASTEVIRSERVPASPVIHYVGPTSGERARGLAAVLLLGLAAAALSAVSVDRLMGRRPPGDAPGTQLSGSRTPEAAR